MRRTLVAAATAAAAAAAAVAVAGVAVPPAAAGPANPDASLRAAVKPAPRLVSGVLPNGQPFTLPPPGTPPYPVAASPAGLGGGAAIPARVESAPAYVAQASCDPSDKPGVTAFKALVAQAYPAGRDWGSIRNCSDDGISEHLEGRAWDWNVNVSDPAQFAAASQLLSWLTGTGPDGQPGYNARRLGIMYLGYNYRIWGAYRAAEGWRVLNNSNPHTDHIHISFTWNGAMKRTSFWTGTVPAQDYGPCRVFQGQPAPLYSRANPSPCPPAPPLPPGLAGNPVLWRGSGGSSVIRAQQALGVNPATGTFGPQTQAAAVAFQKRAGLPVTGAVDAQTWAALGLGGNAAPAPTSTPAPAPAPATPATAPRQRDLRVGSRGPAVRYLQSLLRMSARNRTGYFGPATRRAVVHLQRARKLKPTGIADAAVWAALTQ